MGEKEKMALGASVEVMILIALLMVDQFVEGAMVGSFFIVFIVFGISVATKLLVNQYIGQKQYQLINLLATNNVMKSVILIFYFYFRVNGVYHDIEQKEMMKLVLDFMTIEWIEISAIWFMQKGKYFSKGMLLSIQGMGILGIFIYSFIPSHYRIHICRGLNIGNLVVHILLCYRRKSWEDQYLVSHGIYIKAFVVLGLIQYLLGTVNTNFYQCYNITFVTLNLAKGVCLLLYVYMNCLLGPWNKKIHDLNEAEDIISRQTMVCTMIVNLSHELKTPVNVIRSALDLIALDCKEDEGVLAEISEIRMDCIEMMNIIQDMIDIQRLKGNYIQIKPEIYNVVEVVENVVDAYSRNMENSPFVFNPQNEEIYQDIDLRLFQQSFMLGFNLLIKQVPDSELYIEMGQLKESREVYILIKHEGIRILKDIYYPISKQLKERDCVSLGLTIQLVKLILQLHKAKIEYIDEGNMTMMKMTFPECARTTDEWIAEENIITLREKMRARDIVR